MAIVVSNLANGTNTDDDGGTSIATSGSVSPSSNALVLACVLQINETGTEPDEPTASGNGLTWVVAHTEIFTDTATFTGRGTIFRAMGASPSSGAVTASFGTAVGASAIWTGEATGVDTSGTNGSGAVVQTAEGEGTGTAITATLAAFGDATNNAAFACAFWGGAANNSSPEAGFTGLTELDALTSYGLRAQWRVGQDTSPATTGSATTDWVMLALEIKAAAGGGGRTTRNTRAFPLGMAVGMNWVHPGDCS